MEYDEMLWYNVKWYSTIFFPYPPNWTKFNLTFIWTKPKLSEQSLPHQWRFTYISLLSFEEVLSTLYFSAVWRMMMIRDDQFGGPIMNNRKDLVGKISTLVPTLTSLQCHSWFIRIVPGIRGMALEWGKDVNVWLSEWNSFFITN